MSAYPSLPLFTDAYIADTAHLTNEEHGAYLRLLMFAWRSPGCRIADDDVRLARMLGLTARKWAAIRPAVMAFWDLVDGFWTQKRLVREHQFVAEKVEKKRAAGQQGGRPKALENKDEAKASGLQDGKQNESETKAPTPTPTSVPKGTAEVVDISDPERDLFRRGREVCGHGAGGLVARLLRAKGGNIALARAVIETASTKDNPREYVAAAASPRPSRVEAEPATCRWAI